jgi:hypothetical protein
MRRVWPLAVLALVACHKKKTPCQSALDNVFARGIDTSEPAGGNTESGLAALKRERLRQCNEEHWPAETIRCFDQARTVEDTGRCYGMLTAAVAQAEVDDRKTAFAGKPLELARATLKEHADAIGPWTADHEGKTCPTWDELDHYVHFKGAQDPWGHAYVVSCDGGKIVVLSAGPDGKVGTEDDVRTGAFGTLGAP